MGRANRKRGQTDQHSDSRHWTETHPDAKHWTPHQRALAGMMTEAAYEGLYGRGPVVKEKATGVEGSLFLPQAGPEVIAEMGDWHRGQIAAFLEGAAGEASMEHCTESDPFVGALWRREWETTTRALEDMGANTTLSALNKREARQAWFAEFREQSEIALRGEHFAHLRFSLFEQMLRGKLPGGTSQRHVDGELLEKMSWWSEEHPVAFRLFLEQTLLPALADSHGPLANPGLDRGEVVDVSYQIIQNLFGHDYARKNKEALDNLERGGFFRGNINRASVYQEMLGILAGGFVERQTAFPVDKGEWLVADNKALPFIMGAEMSRLARSRSDRERFLQTRLGRLVAREFGFEPAEAEEAIGIAAEGFCRDSSIWEGVVMGKIDALRAWQMARAAA